MTLLSHYTTRDGFEGIAKTRTFWATNFLDLNDTSEFFYGWRQLTEAALEIVMKEIPDEKKGKEFDAATISEKATNQFKDFIKSTDGYGHLYVTCFAQGKSDGHIKSGILTLWEKFNGHQGYCLQFERDDVQDMLNKDSMVSGDYHVLGMVEVKYCIDRNEKGFHELCFQLSQQLLLIIINARSDIPARLQPDRMWPTSELHRRLLEYCASHKDPCFKDECELRIFAYPSASPQRMPFMPTYVKKPIRMSPAGKRYIVLGDRGNSGIAPRRVIIGTKANPDIKSILANYLPLPEMVSANMPIV